MGQAIAGSYQSICRIARPGPKTSKRRRLVEIRTQARRNKPVDYRWEPLD